MLPHLDAFKRARHFLSIGGTGMLARATLELALEAEAATIIARHAQQFVTDKGLPIDSAVDADWRQAGDLIVAVGRAIDQRGPVALAVVWLHSDGGKALEGLLPLLDAADCRLVHVLGSASGDPRLGSRELRRAIEQYPRIELVLVVLGSKGEGSRRRWLTHDEISRGVLDAVEGGRNKVVGEVAE